MTAKELWKARALYIGHLLTFACCAALVSYTLRRLGVFDYDGDNGDFVVYLVIYFVCLVAIESVLVFVFRRKFRPWRHFSIPPEDRWPRRGSARRYESPRR